jgi:hypothetical protein
MDRFLGINSAVCCCLVVRRSQLILFQQSHHTKFTSAVAFCGETHSFGGAAYTYTPSLTDRRP